MLTDDLVAALDAIPQSAEPPAKPAAEPQFIESMWPGALPYGLVFLRIQRR